MFHDSFKREQTLYKVLNIIEISTRLVIIKICCIYDLKIIMNDFKGIIIEAMNLNIIRINCVQMKQRFFVTYVLYMVQRAVK